MVVTIFDLGQNPVIALDDIFADGLCQELGGHEHIPKHLAPAVPEFLSEPVEGRDLGLALVVVLLLADVVLRRVEH
jgi:hypothetical protein